MATNLKFQLGSGKTVTLQEREGFIVGGENFQASYLIKERIITRFEEHIVKQGKKISILVNDYFRRTAGLYATRGPCHRIPFTEADKDKLWRITGISKTALYDACKESGLLGVSKGTGVDFKVLGDMFNVLCSVVTFILWKYDHTYRYKKGEYRYYQYASLYLAGKFYTSIYYKYFKFDPDQTVMDFTIENMNNKFHIKGFNNVFDYIRNLSDTNLVNMTENLKRGADADILYYIQNLVSRINLGVKGVRREFEKNHKKGNKYEIDKTMRKNSEEDETYLNDDAQSTSIDIETVSRKIMIAFMNESIVSDRYLTMAVYKRGISKGKLEAIINNIKEDNPKTLVALIGEIVAYHLQMGGSTSTIHSKEFLTKTVKAYTVSNTTNVHIVNVKKILHTLLLKYSTDYASTNRMATQSSFKSALFIYTVLFIMNHMN
jgi:hypothetical protein